MAKILSVCNRLQARDYENGNGGKRRVSQLTQFIHSTFQFDWSFAQLIAVTTISVILSFNKIG